MGRAERAKGRRFELLVRRLVRDRNLGAERRTQAETADDRPDIEVNIYADLKAAIECKARGKQCSLAYLISELENLTTHNPSHIHHAVAAKLDRKSPVAVIPLGQYIELLGTVRVLFERNHRRAD